MARAYLRVELCTCGGVNDSAIRTAIVITANQLLVRNSKDASHIRLRSQAECGDNFGERSGLFGADCEIDHGDVGSGHVSLRFGFRYDRIIDSRRNTNGDTSDLSFQLGQDRCDSLGGTGGGGNNIVENATSYEGLDTASFIVEEYFLPRRAFFLLYPSRTC